jgi:hypothetical protein
MRSTILDFAIAACLTFASLQSFAAACCGGSFAAPSIITGDDRAQLTSSYSYTQVDTDVSSAGIWRQRADGSSIQTLKFDFAHLISDRWQIGGTLPLVQNQRQVNSSQRKQNGIADISADIAYEYLPEWNYSRLQPKGVGFFQLTAPTGKSVYESSDQQGLDVTGRGFYAFGLGTVLSKIIFPWDLNLTGEIHQALRRKVYSPSAQGDLILKPGRGASLALGSGWSRHALRLGAGLAWNYEEPVDTEGAIESEGSLARYATGSLVASYLFALDWSTSASYSDQTLFGSPINTSLSHSFFVSLQKRWPR